MRGSAHVRRGLRPRRAYDGLKVENRKAIVKRFGSANEIQIVTEPIPVPQTGEVRVKIEAATVSNTDTLIRKGIYPLLKKKPPLTMGYDFVGVIDRLGEEVSSFTVGDRVADLCQTGGNANYIVREAGSLARVPTYIDPAQAACLILSGMTAYQIFKHYSKVKPGDTFLIHGGSGAVGHTLLQLCQIHKVEAVTTASKNKHGRLAGYGAKTLDYRAPNYYEDLEKAAKGGFDAAFDFTNQRSFDRSFRLLKPGGRLTTCGILTKAQKILRKNPFNFLGFGLAFGWMMVKLAWWDRFSDKEAKFFGIVNSKRDFPERFQEDLDELIALLSAGKLTPYIHEVLGLDEVPTGHRLLEEGKVVGQIVIKMDNDA